MKRRITERNVPGSSRRGIKDDGFTTTDAVLAIALAGLIVVGTGPLLRAYAADLPEQLARTREGIAFHHLSRDLRSTMDGCSLPYWSQGPALERLKNRLVVMVDTGGSFALIREEHAIRIANDLMIRKYRFQVPPAYDAIVDPEGRLVGIRLMHERGLRLDVYFPTRALGASGDHRA
jgi:hypothetical protein